MPVGLVVGLIVTTAPETVIVPFCTATGIILPSLSEKEAFSIVIGELPPEAPLKVSVSNTPDPLIGESGLSLVAANPLSNPLETWGLTQKGSLTSPDWLKKLPLAQFT